MKKIKFADESDTLFPLKSDQSSNHKEDFKQYMIAKNKIISNPSDMKILKKYEDLLSDTNKLNQSLLNYNDQIEKVKRSSLFMKNLKMNPVKYTIDRQSV